MEISNQRILITGANRGIGLGIAKALAKKKNHLYILTRKSNHDISELLIQLGALSVTNWNYDLSLESDLEGCVKKLQQTPIDILINNAGLLTGGLIEEQKPSEIHQMFQVNLLAVVRLSQAVIPGMIARKKGKIVNNASVSAVMHFPGASTYAAAKAGVLAFTNCIHQELKVTGVTTLTLITPGVKTEMFDNIEVLYGKNLETPKDSISIEVFADQVVKAIILDKVFLMPTGTTHFGLMVAKYFPSFFSFIIGKKFNRKK